METRAFLKNLGRVLAERRRAAKLTQEALAERLGATAQWVSEIERGGTPSLEMLLRLADALGTSVPALLDTRGAADPTPAHLRLLMREAEALPEEAVRVLVATAKAIRQEGLKRDGGS